VQRGAGRIAVRFRSAGPGLECCPDHANQRDRGHERLGRPWFRADACGCGDLGDAHPVEAASLASHNLPADHRGTFTKLTGETFGQVKAANPGIASYVTIAERGYALHELTFALLFIVLIAIPFRCRQRWAWWAAWLPVIASLGYTFTFGAHDHTILAGTAVPPGLTAHGVAGWRVHVPPDRVQVWSAAPSSLVISNTIWCRDGSVAAAMLAPLHGELPAGASRAG
jgi:hypothetical protein